MAKKQSREALEQIAGRFRALSEPTRLAIVQELKSGERSVGEIVEAVGLSQANVSKQLSVLRDAGFLRREQKGSEGEEEGCSDDPVALLAADGAADAGACTKAGAEGAADGCDVGCSVGDCDSGCSVGCSVGISVTKTGCRVGSDVGW